MRKYLLDLENEVGDFFYPTKRTADAAFDALGRVTSNPNEISYIKMMH
jgi:hypothetical protein